LGADCNRWVNWADPGQAQGQSIEGTSFGF
jgi:hypothetical protein